MRDRVDVDQFGGEGLMYTGLMANIAILVLAGFVGFAVISKVPNTLHTPLMSGTNAIHGIVVLGALVVLGSLCLLYTSPSPRDVEESRMPSSA